MNTITKSKMLFDNSSKLIISRIENYIKKENKYKKRIEELEIENKQLKMKNINLIESVQTNDIQFYNRFDENGKLYIREADEHIKELNERIERYYNSMEEMENDYEEQIDELDKKNDELIEKYNDLESQLKKLTKELKESKKMNKDLYKQCYITEEWMSSQTKYCEDTTTTTSYRELCDYFESWGELVYGREFKIDKIKFLKYLINYQTINFGWDKKINGTKTNPKINIIIREE
jgi:chromosome segregation ATPase